MGVGASQLPTAKPSRGTQAAAPGPLGLAYGAVTLYGGAFQPTSATQGRPGAPRGGRPPPATPHPPTVVPWGFGLGSPPFGRPYSGDPCWFLFLPLLRCFRSGGSRSVLPRGRPPRFPERRGLFAPGGRSHSGIPGSTAACAYPGRIAACHALRRRPSRAIHRAASVPQDPPSEGRGPGPGLAPRAEERCRGARGPLTAGVPGPRPRPEGRGEGCPPGLGGPVAASSGAISAPLALPPRPFRVGRCISLLGLASRAPPPGFSPGAGLRVTPPAPQPLYPLRYSPTVAVAESGAPLVAPCYRIHCSRPRAHPSHFTHQ